VAAATVQLLSACRDCDERKKISSFSPEREDDLVAAEEAATFQMVLLRPYFFLSCLLLR
jgi:hypothetical protein